MNAAGHQWTHRRSTRHIESADKRESEYQEQIERGHRTGSKDDRDRQDAEQGSRRVDGKLTPSG